MKRLASTFATLVAAALAVGVVRGAAAAPRLPAAELVVAAPAFWCPYSCTAGAVSEGFTIDILRAIFEPLGIPVRLVNENYSRALEEVRAGRYDATPSTFKEEAPGFVFPAMPISRNQYCVFVPAAQTWRYTGADSLAGRRLGIVKGYSYGPELDEAIRRHGRVPGAEFEQMAGEDAAYRLARKTGMNRLDGFIEDQSLVEYLLARHQELKLRNAGCAPPRFAFLALSPAHARSASYARAFDEGIKRLRSSGQLARIMSAYGLRDRP